MEEEVKVYVVTYTGYEEDDFAVTVVSAYSSYALATEAVIEACQKYTDPLGYARDHYDIIERKLDVPLE